MKAPIILQPADVFTTRGRSLISRLIRFFTRRIGEKRTKVNHVGIVVIGGSLSDAVVVEALSKVKQHKLISKYGKSSSSDVAIFRPINLSEEEKIKVITKAKSYVGEKYGFIKILTHLLDWILQGAFVFRRLTQSDNYPICSWLVAHSFKVINKDFGKPAGAASPDDIWDFIEKNPDKYSTVVSLGPLDRFLD